MMRPQSSNQTVHRRISRRIAPAIVIVFVLMGLVGMFAIRSEGLRDLRAAHRLTLADLADQIESEIDAAGADLTVLASDVVVDAFDTNTASSAAAAAGVRSAVVGEFLNWMDDHVGIFTTLRYVDSQGRVLTAVTNTASDTTLVNTDGTTLPKPLYADALDAALGDVFLVSPYTYQVQTGSSDQPRFVLSTPVYGAEIGTNVPGVLQVEIDAYSLLQNIIAAGKTELSDMEGRRALVLNDVDQSLVDTATTNLSSLFVNATGAGREVIPANEGRTGRSSNQSTQQLDTFLSENPGSIDLVSVGSLLISASEFDAFHAPDMPWRLVLIDDAGKALATSNFQSTLLLLGSALAGLGLAGGLIIVMQRTLRPFERAATLARQVMDAQGASGIVAAPDDDTLTLAIVQMSDQVNRMSAEMEAQRQRLRGNLAIAARVGREATLQSDLDTLMNRVVTLICAEYQFHHAQIFMLDDVAQNAVLTYSYGVTGQAVVERGLKVPVDGASAISLAIAERRSYVDRNPVSAGSGGAVRSNSQSRLLLPLFAGDVLVGVLDIQSIEPDVFQDEELQAFELLADQVGIAIYNLRLLQESEQRVEQINTLNRELTRAAWDGVEEKFQVDQTYHYDLRSITTEATGPETDAAVQMPITIRGHVVGSLDVTTPDGIEFTDDEQLILRAVTDRVALAIDRARLFQETQLSLSETSLLYELSRHINEATALEEIIRAIIASVMPGALGGQIVLFDEFTAGGSSQLTVSADWYAPNTQRAQDTLMGLRLPLADHPFVAGWRSDEVTLASDIESEASIDDFLRGVLQSIGARGLVVIPLTIRGQWRGSIVVEFPEPRHFGVQDRRIFAALIDQASVAVDNSLLLRQTESALEEASRLYAASRSLAEGSGYEDVLKAVVDHLLYEAVNQVFIALLSTPTWDAPGATATVVANWTATEDELNLMGMAFTADQFPAWDLLAAPDMRVIEDVYQDSSLDDHALWGLESLGAQSVLIMPLRSANRVIGVIWIGSASPHQYSERDLRIYRSFAEQTSISMEAARLFEQAERRAAQLQTSAQVSQFASSILDLDVLLPRLVDLIRSAFLYDHVQIFLLDREDHFAELRASTGEPGRQLLAVRHRLAKGSASVIGTVTAENRPVVASDTGTAGVVHKPNPYLPNTRSEMALPLVIKDKVVGALDVQSNRPNAFIDEDVSVLTTLAAQISVAIDNARLFEQSERRASDMSLLFAVTSAAASAENLSGALHNVASDLRESLDALSVGVYLPVDYIDEISGDTFTTLRAAAAAGYDGPLAHVAEIHIGDRTSAIGIASQTLRSRIINKVAEELQYEPLIAQAQSAVVVPLTAAGKLIGLIAMENAEPFAYNHETLTLLQTMGSTLTALIQNQQLLEQLQHTNEQLIETDRVKSEFLANMSHELRTPLNSIIGFSRVILKGIDGPLTEMQEQDLSTIYSSGQHLLNLINDILDQAKIAAGKMEIKPDYFDVKAVIDGVRSIGIGLVKDKPVEIKIDIESGLPQVYGDEFRTRQVLLNLLSNATKFTQQGTINICAYRAAHGETKQPVVRVDVTDSGIGIAEKDIPLLFEAFRQVDSSLTRVAGGTGLGLPISKSLIELQGGEMFVQSQVNVGSTFSLTIPLEPPKVKGDTGPLSEPVVVAATDEDGDTLKIADEGTNGHNGNGATPTQESDSKRTAVLPTVKTTKRQILIIEENPDRVDQFRRIIQREGYDVFAASIPLEAEAMASGLRPSIIIMDTSFADGAGWNILHNLKERDDTFDIPVIVVTLGDDERAAREAGAYAFLQHPITPEDLLSALAEAEKESSTQRILIIDDQPETTRLLKQLLDEQGCYRVFAAHNGSEGVSLVARRRPDLVILDLRMPEMDGFAVLNELRSNPETAGIPVLIVTGDTLDLTEQDLLAGVAVMSKTDISLEDCQQFLSDVQSHLSRNGE